MNKKQFDPVDSKVNFSDMEEKILKYWKENKIFEKSLKNRVGQKNFVFYEGPPTANGKPGVHHVLARVFKDLIPRYRTMAGYYCDRKSGWDCHGLPVEIEIEKKIGISGKQQIEEFGIQKFNDLCRASVFEYVGEWKKLTDRIGFWIDMENGYETMSNGFIESGWSIIKECFSKGLLYEDYKVVPYCPRCGTPLSSHELAQGYKDNVSDTSVYVKFRVKAKENTFFLAWTTTPWTLPGNVALAVDPKSNYVEVELNGTHLILAQSRLSVLEVDNPKIINKYKGEDLLNWEYEPLYDFVNYDKKAHFVIPADFVSEEEGTGIVHTAVMYGEDDFELGKKFDLPKKHVVNERGEFISDVKLWAGMFVKKANPLIIEELDGRGLLFRKEEILHTYPFCWRCGTPLLYYALTSWYLKTTAVKDRLLTNNESVNWVPSHIKEGRMGEWLRNNKDWAISRSRYWGTPLPVWRCAKCSETVVVGSVAELQKLSGKDLNQLDLHRPFVDEITWECQKCHGDMKRLSFVLDGWFDSGSMPFSQWHYPFEGVKEFENHFPADFISEAMDQTRGWFYTLQAVSSLLGKESPYKNVICHGLVLDEKGNKMSKSKGNIVDPWTVIKESGADAMRWYFYSVISPGESFKFSTNLVMGVSRRFILTYWNVYSFFVTYANLNHYQPKQKHNPSRDILDRWILIRLDELISSVTDNLNRYDVYASTGEIEKFVSDFSTWYIRRSRDRMNDEFFSTCYEVLVMLTKLLAPFMPFVTEIIYRNLTDNESVHLESWPTASILDQDKKKLLENMTLVRKIVELGHSQRKLQNIPVKQALAGITVTGNAGELNKEEALIQLIKDELNIESVELVDGENLSVVLDTVLTDGLIRKGKAREIIRSIQQARKDNGCRLDEVVDVEIPEFPEEYETDIKRKGLIRNLIKADALKIVRIS